MKVFAATLLLSLLSAEAFTGRPAVRKAISKLDKDNFASTLTEVEPFLLKEAGITFYSKSIRRIENAAKELGVEMPKDYALDAKATAKRREKQNAFIQVKIEEAEAAAAEAAAAEDEAAPEAEAAAEEVTEESAEPVAA